MLHVGRRLLLWLPDRSQATCAQAIGSERQAGSLNYAATLMTSCPASLTIPACICQAGITKDLAAGSRGSSSVPSEWPTPLAMALQALQQVGLCDHPSAKSETQFCADSVVHRQQCCTRFTKYAHGTCSCYRLHIRSPHSRTLHVSTVEGAES